VITECVVDEAPYAGMLVTATIWLVSGALEEAAQGQTELAHALKPVACDKWKNTGIKLPVHGVREENAHLHETLVHDPWMVALV
jgi:hypothetical protein